jgi:hypothetical protein
MLYGGGAEPASLEQQGRGAERLNFALDFSEIFLRHLLHANLTQKVEFNHEYS